MEENEVSKTGITIGTPDDNGNIRSFIDGSTRSHAILRTAAIGLGRYRPGWQWSRHAGPQTGKSSDNHIGYIISGQLMLRDSLGNEAKVGPGDAFEISPGSDAWVIGKRTCIALDFIPIPKSS
jgi:redox-sensitive bicupin YhaK (pirin superfamily)